MNDQEWKELKNEIGDLRIAIENLREGDNGLTYLVDEIYRLSVAVENLTTIIARK